ncbi:class I SAM-dependent methyltransferase [Tepidiphilus baoligensis]|uniref:Methyltransferase domain-containing protein n=1 Tax=Tepidiphilus baoligensis TaxID=2698687 RepID=A0ABX1QNC3_9PROT|nr:class I SAM-dependent methyltransferase [Tepidiphilus baoligensis]NMH16931.1 methyltransferase domain-containing protein [Tepidiphilus baoligensis]
MSTNYSAVETVQIINDEYELIVQKLPLNNARIIELGCGDGTMSCRLAERAGVREIVALEVDEAQLARNLAKDRPASITFCRGAAEAINEPDESFDHAMMLKSLHHVPVDMMDRALEEIHRVLRPGGLLYVSEPVFEGEFNEIMRLFHDEKIVREAAIAAMERSCDKGLFERIEQIYFLTPITFIDFDDFERRMMNPSHTKLEISPVIKERVRTLFDSYMGQSGVRFDRPMRVDLLRKKTYV